MAAVMKEQTFHGRSLEVSLWKRILHHLMEFKQTMIWLILANVVVAATDVALPMFSQYAINELVLNQGNDDQIVPLLSLGGKGVISVLANIAPEYTHDICRKFFDGDLKGSLKMQLDALPLIDKLFCEVNPIPVKTAMNLLGKEVGGLRMPLSPMEEAHKQALAEEMKKFGMKLA